MSNQELILAQEQSVLNRLGLGKEIQGTLVLTNSRLLFVATTEENSTSFGLSTLRYSSDVEDLNLIGQSPSNISIPLDAILATKGSKGIMTNPNLKIKYKAASSEKDAEFVQTIIGGRKKNLNDWARVIDDLKSGNIKIEIPSSLPGKDTLEGRIINSLADLQEKGVFEIEEEIESSTKLISIQTKLKRLVMVSFLKAF